MNYSFPAQKANLGNVLGWLICMFLIEWVIEDQTMQKQENIHVALFPDSAMDKVHCSYEHISV